MSPPGLHVPFRVSSEERLFVITLQWTYYIGTRSSLLFLPSSTILSRLAGNTAQNGRVYKWEEWGPLGTRMILPPPISDTWVCCVYGQKFVAPPKDPAIPGYTFEIYDFNQRDLRRELLGSNSGGPQLDTNIYTEATILKRGIFREEVSTSLPYRLQSHTYPPLQGEVSAHRMDVMCSEDNIILVNVRGCRALSATRSRTSVRPPVMGKSNFGV